MSFLLDTNACIALINGAPPAVRTRFQQAAADGEALAVPSVVVFELWYGVGKSARQDANAARLRTFLAGPLELLALDDEDARIAGLLRATLETAGTPIGAYDLLIAAQALRHGMTLVTANVAEFARVAGLAWEDWAGPQMPRFRR
jgi:tRNA(fMet)-specific endonuclease VapC